MAGIGFVLRKLTRQDDLIGVAGAYLHAALASCGPWLMTVFALWGVYLLSYSFQFRGDVETFRLIIIYNFAFSLVFTGPIYMVVTRFLADSIHEKQTRNISSSLIGALLLTYATQLPILLFAYGYYFEFTLAERLLAVMCFLLISTMWVTSIFIASLKDFRAITTSFFIGMVIAVTLMLLWGEAYSTAGLLAAFSIGIAFIVFTQMGYIFNQYGFSGSRYFAFKGHFIRYWELAVCGFLYNAGIWIDKWVMWFAPERVMHPSGMISYPDHDSAMFLAYFVIVPSLALFVLSVETSFFKKYLKFYRDILQHAHLKRIKQNHKAIMDNVLDNTRAFLVLQGSLSLVAFLAAPAIFSYFNINYMQIGMFRFGVLGTFFQIMAAFLFILLSYFDDRKIVLLLQLVFLLFNGVLSVISMKMGFPYYGLGYFLASMLTFFVSAMAALIYLRGVPYHAFITNNTSVAK
jgi:uncharacterized membrane protein